MNSTLLDENFKSSNDLTFTDICIESVFMLFYAEVLLLFIIT